MSSSSHNGVADLPQVDGSNNATDLPAYFDLSTNLDSCVLHPGQPDCGCNDIDWELPEAVETDPTAPIEEPDYTKFENWIPLHVRPAKPCDYCRNRRLDCYMQRGNAGCTPCLSLFRECSLTNSNTLEARNYQNHQYHGTLLDTLHAVDENTVQERGKLTGIKTLASRGRQSGTTTPTFEDDAPGSSKRNGIRFPKHAVKILRDWYNSHSDYPYPNDEQKAELEQQTELKQTQISNWLANARRRRKDAEKTRPKIAASPSLRPTTPAIDIPASADKEWDEMNPLERWKYSPPENEPADFRKIADAVRDADLPGDDISASPSSSKRPKKSSRDSLSVWSHQQIAPSTTSLGTSKKSSSLSTGSARFSLGSSHSKGSFGSFSSGLGGKKDRKRRRRPFVAPNRKATDDKKRIFQCTFCTDTFKAKYDWTRHEKSLHLSLEKFICAPLGPVITDQATGRKVCVYCEQLDPTNEHLETHNHKSCEEKGLDARTFFRKDHLRQHLRLMHGCDMIPSMDNWKAVATNINSRCGFCAQRFTVWQERVDHLTAHFKAGARMAEWKGCRGLDPAVAAQVTNAMPPYLIGIESVSQIPFSASKRVDFPHHPHELSPCEQDLGEFAKAGSNDIRATCWEILTIRLGRYASQEGRKGVVLTDEMLQSAARRILYESDDPWNQTPADNAEWLDLFKKAHGLDYIPDIVGGEGKAVPEDIEDYLDLGLRVPFSVQLGTFNRMLAHEGAQGPPKDLPSNYSADAARAQGLSALAKLEAGLCTTAEWKGPPNESSSRYTPRHRLCLPTERAKQFATITPAWSESGLMPPSISAADATSTGAMMEFLGPEMGQHLPFSNDAMTSTIPLTTSEDFLPLSSTSAEHNFDWSTVDDSTLMQELNDMIASTTAEQHMNGVPAPTTSDAWMNDINATAMEGVNFDDFTFTGADDGVFDMQMDDMAL